MTPTGSRRGAALPLVLAVLLIASLLAASAWAHGNRAAAAARRLAAARRAERQVAAALTEARLVLRVRGLPAPGEVVEVPVGLGGSPGIRVWLRGLAPPLGLLVADGGAPATAFRMGEIIRLEQASDTLWVAAAPLGRRRLPLDR